MEKNKTKKSNQELKALYISAISVIIFLFFVVGAAYSYLTTSNFDNIKATEIKNRNGNKLEIVATGSAELNMNLTLKHMKKNTNTVSYYATSSGVENTEVGETLATFTSNTNIGAYCDYTIEVTKRPTPNQIDLIDSIKENGVNDEVVLYIKDSNVVLNTIDMKNTAWNNNKTSFSGRLSNIYQGSKDMTLLFKVNNLKDKQQDQYLANAAISLEVQIVTIDCQPNGTITPFIES